MKKVLSLWLSVLLISSMAGCAFHVQPSFHSGDDIRIGDVTYPENTVRLVLRSYQRIYENSYGIGQGSALWSQEWTDGITYWEYVRDHITLEEFCCVAALSQMTDERGISLSEEEQQQIREAAEQYCTSISDESWAGDISAENAEQALTLYRLAQLCIADLAGDVSSDEISDDEIRVIQVRILTVQTQEEAQAVWQRLENGETVAYIVGTTANISDTEQFLRRGEAEEALETTAFRLKTSEYSQPVQLENGWSVLYCENDFVEERSEQNRTEVYESRVAQAWMPVCQQWIEKAGVYLNQEHWENLQPVDVSGGTETLFSVYQALFPES